MFTNRKFDNNPEGDFCHLNFQDKRTAYNIVKNENITVYH